MDDRWNAMGAGASYATGWIFAGPIGVWHPLAALAMLAGAFGTTYYLLKWAYDDWPQQFLQEATFGDAILLFPIYTAAWMNSRRTPRIGHNASTKGESTE